MAITKTISNRLKLELGKGAVNFTSDVFKAILMGTGFTFDPDTHAQLSNVTASQIAATGGYAEKTLTVGTEGTAWEQDNVNDLAYLDWENVTWTASGANFVDFIGILVYDDTHADDVVVGYIGLGQTITLVDGNSFQAQNMGFETT